MIWGYSYFGKPPYVILYIYMCVLDVLHINNLVGYDPKYQTSMAISATKIGGTFFHMCLAYVLGNIPIEYGQTYGTVSSLPWRARGLPIS